MVATPVSIHGVYLYWIGASSPPPLSKTFLSYSKFNLVNMHRFSDFMNSGTCTMQELSSQCKTY